MASSIHLWPLTKVVCLPQLIDKELSSFSKCVFKQRCDSAIKINCDCASSFDFWRGREVELSRGKTNINCLSRKELSLVFFGGDWPWSSYQSEGRFLRCLEHTIGSGHKAKTQKLKGYLNDWWALKYGIHFVLLTKVLNDVFNDRLYFKAKIRKQRRPKNIFSTVNKWNKISIIRLTSHDNN